MRLKLESDSVKAPHTLDQCLTTPEFFDNPYPTYHRLRTEAPVYWSESWQAWLITRYMDVMAVLRDSDSFSNVGRQARLMEQLPEVARERLHPLEDHYVKDRGLINSDPPDHTRLRALINKAFTPRVLERLRPRIQKIVDELLDAIQDSEEVDIINEFAYPLPAIVIAEMLGVPADKHNQFTHWSKTILTFLGTSHYSLEAAEQAQQSLLELRAYMLGLLAERRQKPQEDLMSGLIAAEERGDVLSEGELLATCVTLLIAGHETTANLIGNGLLALLRHPDQLQLLKDEPTLIDAAVEELLRYDTSVQSMKRLAKKDVEFGGQQIKQGQLVYAMLGAANRDPAQFSEPDRLDITRRKKENRHLAFGYGIHFCLGAPLARLEAPIALNTLLRRFPDLHLTDETPLWRRSMFRGLQSFPIFLR